jgi:hypothetical protein
MTCETCNDRRTIQQRFEVDRIGRGCGHYTRPVREEVPCPDCRRCSACGLFVDENPMHPLHEWRPLVWWCDGDCLSKWLDAQIEGRNITIMDALLLVLVVRDVYDESPDADPGYRFDTVGALTLMVEGLERAIALQSRPKEGA